MNMLILNLKIKKTILNKDVYSTYILLSIFYNKSINDIEHILIQYVIYKMLLLIIQNIKEML